MKRILLLFTLFIHLTALAQVDNIIVLIDVSGSVQKYDPTASAEVVSDVIEGLSISNPNFTLETFNGSKITPPLTGINKKMIVIPFGNLERDDFAKTIVPEDIFDVRDVRKILSYNFPKQFNDTKTYRELAEARTAELAKKYNMETYWLFMISDRTGNDFLGQDAGYSNEQQTLINSINTPVNKVDETKMGVIKFRGSSKYKIDISRFTLENWTPPPASSASSGSASSSEPAPCKIKLVTFASSTSKIPGKVDKTPFNVNWTCNCPEINSYKVSVSGIKGSKVDPNLRSRQVNGNSISFNLEDGNYRILVSAVGAGSSQAFIQVSTGSSMGLLLFLILILSGAAGYYFWNKNRSAKTTTKAPKKSNNNTGKAPDPFDNFH